MTAAVNRKTARAKTRRPGRPGHLGEAARALGVNHSHLWRVVRGERHSRRLAAEYSAWKRDHGL